MLERFQPWRPVGSAPYHYILGDLGAYVLASHYHLDVKKLLKRVDKDCSLALSSNLVHLIEINDFFVALIGRCRQVTGYRVATWWSEHRCVKEWRTGDEGHPLVRPDAEGLLRGPADKVAFFLEVDRGTERGDRLTDKLKGYEYVARLKLGPGVLLFLFPSAARELNARGKLHLVDNLLIATSHRELHEADPLGANWQPLDSNERLPMIELRTEREEITL